MKPPPDQCPDEKFLEQLVAGSLVGPAAAALERHAEGCAACRDMLAALDRTSIVTPGDLAGQLRAGQPAVEILAPGDVVGRYVVIERLGSGGMGIVYAANDPELGRNVALKLLRADRFDTDGGAVEDRMVREAQSMARLSHPNVVAVHDVGRVGDQVFIAMELVDGQTLTRWLAESPRSWRDVVAVYLAAGRGLEAAHDAGVLHRDFKPDNVLVGRDGRVRVMDFGLARSTAARLPAHQAIGESPPDRLAMSLTRTGDVFGTPYYMAPEQLTGEPTDPRSDQFSFCVALWEALHGQRPFDGDSLESLRTAVGEGKLREPRRAGVPGRLRRIVARGLAVAPDARYPSMGVLLAALASTSRRRWTWVAAAAAAVLLAAAALFLPRGEASQAELCTGAEQSFSGIWDPGQRAGIEKAFAAARVPYATDAWKSVGRILDGYRDRWVSMHTDACKATRVRGDQPEDVLRLRMICLERRRKDFGALVALLSSADAKLVEKSVSAASGLPDLAVCADISALTAVLPPPTDPAIRRQVDELEDRLARARALNEAGNYAPALEQVRSITAAATKLSYRPFEAEAFLLQGDLERELGEREAAEKSLLRAVWAAEAGKHDRAAAQAWTDLVFLVGYTNAKHDRGRELSQHATAVLERLGGDYAIQSSLERALGTIDSEEGKLDKAAEHFERAIALLEPKLGPDHLAVVNKVDDLGIVAALQGNPERALELHGRVLAVRERVLGTEHPMVAQSLVNLGNEQSQLGRNAEAEKLYRRALALRERALGPDSADVGMTLVNLGRALSNQGRMDEALQSYQRGLAVGDKALGPEHPALVIQLLNTGLLLKQLGRYSEALAHYRRAQRIAVKAFGPDHVQVAYSWMAMGDLLLGQGRTRQGIAQFQRALPVLEKTYGPTHPQVAETLTQIGKGFLDLGQAARALPVLERLNSFPPGAYSPRDLGLRRFFLAQALWETKRDRPRARRLAQSARADLARAEAGPESENFLPEVDRWLKRHRRR